MKRLLWKGFAASFLILAGCSTTMGQMKDSMDTTTAMIKENTNMMTESGSIIKENTHAIKASTSRMEYGFPILCASVLVFNYMFLNRIVKKIESLFK